MVERLSIPDARQTIIGPNGTVTVPWYSYLAVVGEQQNALPTTYLALAGGTMTGAIAMGGSKVTGLGAATANGDAVRYEQVLAGQLAFPASQNASADANTLDDYEEGTWVPALTFGGGSTGLTYASRSGRYTKIGRLVLLDVSLTLSAKGTSTGDATITGVPFAPGLTTVGTVSTDNIVAEDAGYYTVLDIPASTQAIRVRKIQLASGDSSNQDDVDFANDSSLAATFIYSV